MLKLLIATILLISSTSAHSQSENKSTLNVDSLTEPGMIAPDINGINLFTGKLISLSENKGKYILVDFWATTCPPCISEFPNISKAYEKYDRNKFEVLGIVDDRTKGRILSFLKDKNVTWPTIDRKAVSTSITGYNVYHYPTSFLIDPDGKIIAKNLWGNQLEKNLSVYLQAEKSK